MAALTGPSPPAAIAVSVAVATSGGRDSTALLHCVARQARPHGLRVIALHVHHGLMPQADAWLAQVRRQARAWGTAFAYARLATSPARGESVEAWARRERYAALTRMAVEAGCGTVLLAHHREDQAETVLLQALRGAGPAGLAAMPAQAMRGGISWLRPWLQQPRSAIESYRRRHRLAVVDDGSNADPRFARSRLRGAVWPAMQAAFPHAAPALLLAARRAHEAATLATEVADADLPALIVEGGELDVAVWLRLPPARRCNALRAWLSRTLGPAVPESLVARLSTQLPGVASARWPAPHHWLVLSRGRLGAETVAGAAHAAETGSARGESSDAGRRPSPKRPDPRF